MRDLSLTTRRENCSENFSRSRSRYPSGVTDAFYIREDENLFAATPWTIGPWDDRAQHAGPPAALLGRAIEQVDDAAMQVARIVLDVLKPVPVGRLQVSANIVRDGRKVQLVEASLATEEGEVMRASAWRIRSAHLELASRREPTAAPPLPTAASGEGVVPKVRDADYMSAIEWRFSNGGFFELGPAAAWMRMRHPLVDGEDIAPLSRVLVIADSANGISATLDFTRWIYVNTDLTVHLQRMPRGEWVCLKAETFAESTGVGATASTLYDEEGPIGTGAQSLFIDQRR